MGRVGYLRERARELSVPRPLLAAAPLAVAGALVVVLAAVRAVPGAVAFVVVAGCLLLAAFRGALASRDRWALRRTADALLRTGVRIHPQSALLVWRAAELSSDRNRLVLARLLVGILREVERPSPFSAVPLNRPAVRPHVDFIRALIARLRDLARPVTAAGIVLVEELLTDGFASPLYVGGAGGDVRMALARCLSTLDVCSFPTALAATSPNPAADPSADQHLLNAAGGGRD